MTLPEGQELVASRVGGRSVLATALDAMIQMLCDAVAAERGSILLETSPGTLRIRAARGIAPDVVARSTLRVGEGIAGSVAATGVPKLLRDAERLRTRSERLDYANESALCVPLVHPGGVIGVVNLSNKRLRPGGEAAEFDEQDLALAATLASHAALVIANARELADAEVRGRLERSLASVPTGAGREAATLAVMGLVSDSLVTPGPLDEVLSDIARHATALLGASRGSLMLRIPGTQELRMAAAVNIPAEVVSEARARIGEGIAGLCAQRGEPLLIPDVEEAGISHPPEYLSRYENQSAICVPLRFRDEILGVLSLNDRKDGKDFSPDDLFIAEIIASQASIAIWTSRMLEESMQAAATHRSLDVARAIQRSFLPADLERPDVAISTLCISADATGGDYVDCWTMRDADDRETGELVLAIGDATGHGIGSALVSTTCRASLRALFLGDGEIGHVMQHLDRLLERDLRQGRFVTLFLGRLDPASGRLVYSSAGHPPGLLFRDALGPCAELSATGPPLGLGLGGAFPTRELTLRPGDMLAMVTDGVLDARNEAGEVFGAARLAGTLAGLAQAAPRDVVAGLRRRLAGFARPAALADDLSAIVVKLREARASPRPKG